MISGLFDLAALKLAAMLLPVMALSLYAGGHMHLKIGQDAFKRGIRVLLIGSGIVLLAR